MLLKGYFDDTGTHNGSPIVGVAGLVGEVSEWAKLEPEWQDTLRRYGVPDFHAFDCQNCSGKFEGMRDSLMRELARIIADSQLTAISACVEVTAWNQVCQLRIENGTAFFSRFVSPFALCFEHCVQAAAIFNEQRDAAGRMVDVFDAYKATTKWGPQLSALSFARNAGRPAIQAADLLAAETFRYWFDTFDQRLSSRPVVDIIWKQKDFNQMRAYRALGLVNAIRRFNE